MKYMTFTFYLLFALLISNNSLGQVTVTENLTASQLVQKLVGAGVSFSNPTLKCEPVANGIFNVISSNLGLDSGIVLTTGRSREDLTSFDFGINSPAFNEASTDHSFINPANGDPQLDSLLVLNDPTIFSQDACVLEFDFIPVGDTLQFRYVFGSEEYTDYSCDVYNDIFAFFLTGPGYSNATNIALIPGTNIPVAVNSTTDTIVNFPFDPTLCTGMGFGSPFSQYYVDNVGGTTIVYNGFTSVFTAKAPVTACSTYHIKLAIADASDGILDSGVFLEAGSFSSTSIVLDFASSIPGNGGSLMEGCRDGVVTVRRARALSTPQTVHLVYSGTATKNIDYGPAPDSVIIPAFDSVFSFVVTAMMDGATEGVENLAIAALGSCNNAADSISIPIIEQLGFQLLSRDTSFCEGQDVTIPLHVSGDPNLSFTWTANPSSPIASPNDTLTFVNPTITTTYTVDASIAGCPAGTASFTVTVEPGPDVNIIPADTSVCLEEPMKLVVVTMPAGAGYTYLWSPGDMLDDTTVLEPNFFSQDLGDHRYRLTVTTPAGCKGSDSVVIRAKPPMNLIDVSANATIRYGDEIQLNAGGATYYTWLPDKVLDYPNIPNPIAKPQQPTTFTVYGLNEHGCADTAAVHIDIDYTMPEFVPSAFSPNGDGRNDLFHVVNLKYQRLIEFRVFNRWGQEVFSTTDADTGWDGRFKGVDQEIGVYHYLIRLARPDGSAGTFKGDVTLIR